MTQGNAAPQESTDWTTGICADAVQAQGCAEIVPCPNFLGDAVLVPEPPLAPISREEKETLFARLDKALRDPATLNEMQAKRCAIWQPAVVKVLSHLIARFNRCAHVRFDLNLATVCISFDEFKILLNELLENALAYSNPKSDVVVKGRVSGSAYLVCVSDEGEGMHEDDFSHVTPYHQSEPQEDDGLGLHLCKRIAEVHSGALTIRSTPGEGTTATVVLPLG
ncbi:sensor histidine kinase [Acanthopleuribacter pedis]|uniref:histidine kinase n=1 Tax=Acanthopleuribacter pedis TaxID=442870 RepID=A0A8J7Q9S0_9BACT|nr:ATP-binding protein [Acanthopleuribacter pedis]MBO1319594.1 hypothetical protein [Acanthopleuribacter pedis]